MGLRDNLRPVHCMWPLGPNNPTWQATQPVGSSLPLVISGKNFGVDYRGLHPVGGVGNPFVGYYRVHIRNFFEIKQLTPQKPP